MDKDTDAISGSSGVDRSSISAFQAGDPGFKFFNDENPGWSTYKSIKFIELPTQASVSFWIEKT